MTGVYSRNILFIKSCINQRLCISWVIIHGKVYDVTNFLADHPGGKKVLLKASGKDATKQFDSFHNKSVLEKIGSKFLIGEIGTAEEQSAGAQQQEEEEQEKSFLQIGETFGDMVPFGDPMW